MKFYEISLDVNLYTNFDFDQQRKSASNSIFRWFSFVNKNNSGLSAYRHAPCLFTIVVDDGKETEWISCVIVLAKGEKLCSVFIEKEFNVYVFGNSLEYLKGILQSRLWIRKSWRKFNDFYCTCVPWYRDIRAIKYTYN